MLADRPLHMLFVCGQNVTLSPLAAGLMAMHARDLGAEIRVASAGINGGAEAFHPTTTWLLSNRGVRFERTASQVLDDALVDGADLILTMTFDQAATVTARFGLEAQRVLSIGQFVSMPTRPTNQSVLEWLDSLSHFPDVRAADGRWDIADPADGPDSAYLGVDVELDRLTRRIVAMLTSEALDEPQEGIDLRADRSRAQTRTSAGAADR